MNELLQTFITTWLPHNVQAAMLRLDRLHPEIQGNKWFKLKYNLEAAQQAGKRAILTFGGAYSNHIAATAAACRMAHWPCLAVIRGERPPVLSHTLAKAEADGMELLFISREAYRDKQQTDWAALFPDHYIVPEGGHNDLGARGCEDILDLAHTTYTHLFCAVGTGTTLAGLVNAGRGEIIGISALKGALSLQHDVQALLKPGHAANWRILHDYHEGGYGKINANVIGFMNDFFRQTGIPLDGVYTGKMMLAVKKLAETGYFPAGSQLLCIHTGGLQGNLSLAPGVLCF
ncbi:pyridoxal-phosphate dependent enzyme [Chitinophaga horti]|uniref:Pyridoxal-phosphate dependent enzyme n=1 Tax=Chitinophaga horti TaxID=2920382 RepID=A0ABY6J2M9_9BACT|nr:pyridoxal-phosphate dependent enzyme [Chitinophaga horti]UYQ93919.1 pyridoxal-phosphate dependent enzyme [Chitinophaga horti]